MNDESITLTAGDLYPVLRVTLTDDTGNPLDLSNADSAEFTLRAAGGAAPLFTADATIIDPPTQGTIEYAWRYPNTENPGDYEGSFRVRYPIGTITYPTRNRIAVHIAPSPTAPSARTWLFTTPAAAAAVVSMAVSEENLATAEQIISILADVTAEDVPTLSARDAALLATAAAYQAAWVAENPGLLTMADVLSLSQDGASVTFGAAGSRLLSPLARRALNLLGGGRALRSVVMVAEGAWRDPARACWVED